MGGLGRLERLGFVNFLMLNCGRGSSCRKSLSVSRMRAFRTRTVAHACERECFSVSLSPVQKSSIGTRDRSNRCSEVRNLLDGSHIILCLRECLMGNCCWNVSDGKSDVEVFGLDGVPWARVRKSPIGTRDRFNRCSGVRNLLDDPCIIPRPESA